MKNIPEDILDTVLLEEYALGITDAEDTIKVELLLKQYPDLREKLQEIEIGIEHYAKSYRKRTPQDLKAAIMRRLPAKKMARSVHTPYWAYAAAISAIILSLAAFTLWNENRTLNTLNESLFTSLQELEHIERVQSSTLAQYERLAHPASKKLNLYANHWDTPLNSVAYWNEESKTSFISIHSMPQLEGKCFQIWADVEGEMINLGILTKEGTELLLPIVFKDSASSLNITVEPLGGSEHPTVSNLVSSVSI